MLSHTAIGALVAILQPAAAVQHRLTSDAVRSLALRRPENVFSKSTATSLLASSSLYFALTPRLRLAAMGDNYTHVGAESRSRKFGFNGRKAGRHRVAGRVRSWVRLTLTV